MAVAKKKGKPRKMSAEMIGIFGARCPLLSPLPPLLRSRCSRPASDPLLPALVDTTVFSSAVVRVTVSSLLVVLWRLSRAELFWATRRHDIVVPRRWADYEMARRCDGKEGRISATS